MKQLHYKLCVSLLRYTAEIRVDQAFYDAGMAARAMGNDHMAFILLNRYLDLYDAIDDPDSASLENGQFQGTDIPSPYDVPLPEKNFLPADQKDEVGDWVLQKNMDIGQ
jgi:intraflagellar transport protein 172